MKKIILFFVIILTVITGFAKEQQLSPSAEISIITVDPGELLLDTWGHSAIRIKDRQLNLDRVYNYGMYDFNTSGFYMKFMRGQLLYDLAAYPFHYFLKAYKRENREVREQVLQLTQEQKQKYFDFLENNAKPENKKYLYDFFFDNCATKMRDVNTEVLKTNVNYKDELTENKYTFRELIYQKLDNHPWAKFGIDIALGSVIDDEATVKQYTFLPSYAYDSFKNTTITVNGEVLPLIKETNILYKSQKREVKKSSFTPVLFFTILSILIIFITYRDYKNKKRTKWLDFTLMIVTGLIGLLVFLLWFATDHKATKVNLNLFWAFLPNLVVAFYVLKNKAKFLKKYYMLLLTLQLVMLVIWIFKIQVYNLVMIPILLMLGVRYFYNYFNLSKS